MTNETNSKTKMFGTTWGNAVAAIGFSHLFYIFSVSFINYDLSLVVSYLDVSSWGKLERFLMLLIYLGVPTLLASLNVMGVSLQSLSNTIKSKTKLLKQATSARKDAELDE